MKPVRKAVFPVADFGIRFLPAIKAMPKELLPIVDKPLIQYAAEEAIAAGIDTLIFVTGRNKRAIEDHFDSNQELEAALRAKGKNEQAQMVRSILPDGVECIFVRQPEQLGLGHAVLCAERAVGHDPFTVLLADDFLTYEGAGVIADLVKGYEVSGRTQLSVMEVDGPDISKYGVVQPGAANGSVAGLVEKPTFEQAPSNLASIGRYVLTPDIFEILRGQAPGAGGEIQLADAINTQAAAGQVESYLQDARVGACLAEVRHTQGRLIGKMEALGFKLREEAVLTHPDTGRRQDKRNRRRTARRHTGAIMACTSPWNRQWRPAPNRPQRRGHA